MVIHLWANMLKLNSTIIRPSLMWTPRATALSERRFSSILEPESSTQPLPVDGYKLSSGDTIPSVGLGTWRVNGDDVGKAVKVGVPEGCLTEENPNGDIQAALNAGYRHIDCAWEYGVLHVHTIS